jgi:nicotinate-nucleotide adenylyltransferase
VGTAFPEVAEPVQIGVFGGTFDPPHVGHLIVAREALERLDLDAIWFVPAHRSPFKAEADSSRPEVRLEMVERAIRDDAGFGVSRVEIDRAPPSYMVDTLRLLSVQEPAAEWTLLLGADQWTSFGQWRDPSGIAAQARIAVMARDGIEVSQAAAAGRVPWIEVPVSRIDISSSTVRKRVATGRSVRHMIPEAVRAFIESKELYTSC